MGNVCDICRNQMQHNTHIWHTLLLLLDAITNEEILKLIQLDTIEALLPGIPHLQVPIILSIFILWSIFLDHGGLVIIQIKDLNNKS